MNGGPCLVIFDVDGTLVDSQAHIAEAMGQAFDRVGLPRLPHERVLSIVGLSLDRAMPTLAPDADGASHLAMIAAYKQSYAALRRMHGAASSPLYPGVREMLEQVARDPSIWLGVATGKSRRGLDALLAAHGLNGVFASLQTADDHPSKPHPAMIAAAMAETGAIADRTVMIGDTSFDMDMARAAGCAALPVGWGYHPPPALEEYGPVLRQVGEIPAAIERALNTEMSAHG